MGGGVWKGLVEADITAALPKERLICYNVKIIGGSLLCYSNDYFF